MSNVIPLKIVQREDDKQSQLSRHLAIIRARKLADKERDQPQTNRKSDAIRALSAALRKRSKTDRSSN